MSNSSNLVIEPLSSFHNRTDFNCGVLSLNNYIKKQANQDVKRRISRVFVARIPELPSKLMGYYTLSSLSIELNSLPEKVAKKLPKHPIPTALIGRLAVSQDFQNCGVGKMLLVDAIKRTLGVSDEIAIYAMVVDAIDEQAEAFYLQFGFSLLSSAGESSSTRRISTNRRLFLPLKSKNTI